MPKPIRIEILHNPIKDYAWGSKTAIPELLGIPNPEGKPQAELWMGAHPSAPSTIRRDGKDISLIDIIEQDPVGILGEKVAQRFSNKLPFLLKVLAAGDPLSIQAHPNKQQAEAGFKRENELGIELTAFNRSYKDDNHKPEIICALEPFWALKGFRRIGQIVELFGKVQSEVLAENLQCLTESQNTQGLREFYSFLMLMGRESKERAVSDVVKAASDGRFAKDVCEWILKLDAKYPGDVGVISPILLNLVLLQPGEALYLPAGELHAYLAGVGIELMANSDNVLRGGLTPKFVDVQELLSVLTFQDREPEILTATTGEEGREEYPTEAEEFRLSRVRVAPGIPRVISQEGSVVIMICVRGATDVADARNNEPVAAKKGDAVWVPSTGQQCMAQGDATCFVAGVGNC